MKNEIKKKALKLDGDGQEAGVRSDIKAGAIHSNAIVHCTSAPNTQ